MIYMAKVTYLFICFLRAAITFAITLGMHFTASFNGSPFRSHN